MSKTPEYRAWASMKARCGNQKTKNWAGYGGRGITVCDRWKDSFQNFFLDMGRRPTKHHSLDRKDNDLGYTAENCRWTTRKWQALNRRNSTAITYRGITRSLSVWAARLGIRDHNRIRAALAAGEPMSSIVKWEPEYGPRLWRLYGRGYKGMKRMAEAH